MAARTPFRASPRRDAHQALIAALAPMLPAGARLLRSRSTPWASVTFLGTRHELSYALDPPTSQATAGLVVRLPEAEFALPGHFVAEIKGAVLDDGLSIEAVTVEFD